MLSVNVFLETSISLVLLVTQSTRIGICREVVNLSVSQFNSRFVVGGFLHKGVGKNIIEEPNWSFVS